MPRIVSDDKRRSNIERLRKRLEKIQELNPSTVSQHDPNIDALQAALDDALYTAFGGVNDRYNRYRRTIDWAAEISSFGETRLESQFKADVKKGRDEVLTMLAAAIEVLEEELVEAAPSAGSMAQSVVASGMIFIGHGRSPVWRELKDFLKERLNLNVDEFNSVSVAGVATAERLKEVIQRASFAFIIMTAEDEQPDGKKRARENVVHEVGLLQGRLGFERAIILLEDGCEEFSNIHGLGQVRFPKGDISAKFEEIRRVLEREHQLK